MRNAFYALNPFVTLLFFAVVIGFSMLLMQPVCLVLSLFCASLNAVCFGGKKAAASLKFLIPLIALTAVVNPVFNHRGATILCYLPWGNPLTLESILYGAASAVMLASVVLWFVSFNRIMTSDKIIYLFGRIIPSLSLLISMILRFVPRFISQLKEVAKAQKGVAVDSDGNTFSCKIRNAVRLLSHMLSRSLENAVETSDSMKCRGYGLKKRTSFSIFGFTKTDGICLAAVLVSFAVMTGILLSGCLKVRYFPSLKAEQFGFAPFVFYAVYAAFSLLPLILCAWEGIRWKRLRSKI